MKILFIGLTLTEILAIVFIPHWVGRLLYKIPFWKEGLSGASFWFIGIAGIMYLILMLGIVCLIVTEILPFICRINWRWTKKIVERIRGRI